jgi:hypothetical protein
MGQHPKEKPVQVEGVPEEEDVSEADVAERIDDDPDEVPNATDPEGVADATYPEER